MAGKQSLGLWKINAKLIPSLFTSINLLLGIISLIFTSNMRFTLSAVMILAAMILDGMDGKLARRLNVSSEFGKELDSLADLVSFGVAPALLIYFAILIKIGLVGLIISAAFALCGALRLARFNVMGASEYFIGVPITAAGSFMALMVFLEPYLPFIIYPILMIILSFLMLSKIKVRKY